MTARDTVGIPDYTEPAWLAAVRAKADAAHLLSAGERTLTLGQLTDRLAEAPADVPVEFRGCGLDGLEPEGFISWRGVYADLALVPIEKDEKPITAGELRARCLAADGGTYEGYKGGDYTMGPDTPVWADFYGEVHEWGIVAIRPLMRGEQVAKVLLIVQDWDEVAP